MRVGQSNIIQRILMRLILLLVVLLAVNAGTYMVTRFLALRGPLAYGYIPDGKVSLAEIPQGYTEYLGHILRGDVRSTEQQLGIGTIGNDPLIPMISEALKNSLVLLGISIVFAAVFGIALGLLSVNHNTRSTNPIGLLVSIAGFSMPGFYLGILVLALMFTLASRGIRWNYLPASGYGLDKHLILPVLALGIRPMAEVARMTAELLSEELGKDYVRAARAKGLPWRLVIVRHAFRNVAATIVTALGNSLSYLIGSLVIIEQVFLWPGLGHLLLDSIQISDFAGTILDPVLIATLVTTGTLLYLIFDLFTDVISQALDPRLRRA